MLGLRSLLVIAGSDADGMVAARRTAADAVVLDLASPAAHADRVGARARLARAVDLLPGLIVTV